MTEGNREVCRGILGFNCSAEEGKYLGQPYIIGRSKRAAVENIKEQVVKKIGGWDGHNINPAGNEVLIKSVLLSIPIYTMACVRIPTEFCASKAQRSGNTVVHSHEADRWNPPSRGSFKINVDGALDKNRGKGGVGGVVRDEMEQIVKLAVIPLSNVWVAEIVEIGVL
ncbi:hypothetical protein Vadar_004942 [Vaccinium darrowii]|uniref:Uncharacterized protein n=1 Tax=Vaccinium darrowii TaxID=229202 RepID=A0ACB7X834_9ERIC|nr:hypothetical protein Vadar_004942 [Vaccinium darrowii]